MLKISIASLFLVALHTLPKLYLKIKLPTDDFIQLCLDNHCDQVTLVPDAPDQKTSDHGWDVEAHNSLLKKTIKTLHKAERRVSLFLDPVPELINDVLDVKADRIELYTGPFAEDKIDLEAYAATAKKAEETGLEVNAGHDLNLENLAKFITAVPYCAEVSIGHALTADALKYGWHGAVTAYLTAIKFGHKK